MPLLKSIKKTGLTVVALAALALGGSALAGAATKSGSSGTSSSGTALPQDHRGGRDRQPLSADVAAKVKQAALDKVPGASVLRTQAGGPYGSAYHAHIKTSGGKLEVVLVDSSFKATTVQADNGRGGKRGGHGGPNGHKPETPLTGDTKDKVEAAVKAQYPDATIERTETNTDGSAPYESHIRTSDGKELEVQVSKDFDVVASNARPAHP